MKNLKRQRSPLLYQLILLSEQLDLDGAKQLNFLNAKDPRVVLIFILREKKFYFC